MQFAEICYEKYEDGRGSVFSLFSTRAVNRACERSGKLRVASRESGGAERWEGVQTVNDGAGAEREVAGRNGAGSGDLKPGLSAERLFCHSRSAHMLWQSVFQFLKLVVGPRYGISDYLRQWTMSVSPSHWKMRTVSLVTFSSDFIGAGIDKNVHRFNWNSLII